MSVIPAGLFAAGYCAVSAEWRSGCLQSRSAAPHTQTIPAKEDETLGNPWNAPGMREWFWSLSHTPLTVWCLPWGHLRDKEAFSWNDWISLWGVVQLDHKPIQSLGVLWKVKESTTLKLTHIENTDRWEMLLTRHQPRERECRSGDTRVWWKAVGPDSQTSHTAHKTPV